MSKLAIKGNDSGTGTFTIAAPNSNTDRTLTLPDEAGTVLTSASTLSSSNLSGALPAIDGSALTGIAAGITETGLWQVNAAYSQPDGSWQDVTSWTEWNNGKLGTGMTQSSGVFTFPSTGIWKMTWAFQFYRNSAGLRLIIGLGQISSDGGSNWTDLTQATSGMTNDSGSSNNFALVNGEVIYDITNVSNDRFRFRTYSAGGSGVTVEGGTSKPYSWATFTKLGET